jgi:hypothetical protein
LVPVPRDFVAAADFHEVPIMNRIEKLRDNIERLKDSLALDWNDLAKSLSDEQRIEIGHHLEWCLTEMTWCLSEMKKLSQSLRETKPN